MSITMKYISEKLKVSISTVSRALKNDENISPQLRKKIIEFAAENNYKRRKLKADNILLYLIDKKFFSSTNQFFNRVIEGIEEEAKSNKYVFVFNTINSDEFLISNININVNKVAGIIITGCYHDELILRIKKLNIPMVLIDYYLPLENISSILVDNIDGIIIGMKYLASLGHKRIGYLTGDFKNDIGGYDRLIGYQRSIEMFNLEKDEDLIIKCGYTLENAYKETKKFLLNNKNLPTAIMAVNDMAAIGSMEAIKEKNLRIPKDISLLGFDNIPLSNEVIPKLSTLHVKKKTMGRLAVQRLTKIIQGEDFEFNKIMIKPEMLVRESTKKISNI